MCAARKPIDLFAMSDNDDAEDECRRLRGGGSGGGAGAAAAVVSANKAPPPDRNGTGDVTSARRPESSDSVGGHRRGYRTELGQLGPVATDGETEDSTGSSTTTITNALVIMCGLCGSQISNRPTAADACPDDTADTAVVVTTRTMEAEDDKCGDSVAATTSVPDDEPCQ